jgi:tripartite-type tricarboxylate transporter receptor subunit TctC
MLNRTPLAAALAAGLAALAAPALAEYPEKPVNFIVPWPPGDLEDVITRMIAEDFQAEYGVPAAVVNKPGGGGGPFPGAIEVATAPADGYTVGSFVIDVPVVGDKIGIDELTPMPFEPIGIFITYLFVIAASKDAPYDTLEELAEYAKTNDVALAHYGEVVIPTKVTFALAKNGGYSYGADAAYDVIDCNTLASGDADVINTPTSLLLPCLDDVQVLAAVTEERVVLAPDAPMVSEADPTLDISLWNGLFVHKDTPQDVRDKIAAVAAKTVMSERAQKLGAETGGLIYWQDADAAAARIVSDIAVLDKIEALLAK